MNSPASINLALHPASAAVISSFPHPKPASSLAPSFASADRLTTKRFIRLKSARP